ncbi:MAG: DUF1540 domain-containing protein [Mobilitalea sp.]
MAIKKMDRPNEGISCEVNTCEYHSSGNHCCAEKIQVAPKNAREADQTDCMTFVAKG